MIVYRGEQLGLAVWGVGVYSSQGGHFTLRWPYMIYYQSPVGVCIDL